MTFFFFFFFFFTFFAFDLMVLSTTSALKFLQNETLVLFPLECYSSEQG